MGVRARNGLLKDAFCDCVWLWEPYALSTKLGGAGKEPNGSDVRVEVELADLRGRPGRLGAIAWTDKWCTT